MGYVAFAQSICSPLTSGGGSGPWSAHVLYIMFLSYTCTINLGHYSVSGQLSTIDVDTLTVPAPAGLSKTLVTRVTGGSDLQPDELEKVHVTACAHIHSFSHTLDLCCVWFNIFLCVCRPSWPF